MLKPTVPVLEKLRRGPHPKTPRRVFLNGGPPGWNLVHHPSGNLTWALKYQDQGGKRKFARIGTYPATPVADAERLAWELRGKIERGESVAPKPKEKPPGTVRELRDAYLAALQVDGAKTLYHIRNRLDKLPRELLDKPAVEVTRADILRIINPKVAEGKLASAKSTLTKISGMFGYGLRVEAMATGSDEVGRWRLERNPCENVAIRGYDQTKSADVVWADEEVAHIWANAVGRSGAVVGLAVRACIAAGGLRVLEVLKLRWEDWDREQDTITLRDTKTGDDRVVMVTRHLREVLLEVERYTHTSNHIFPGNAGNAYASQDSLSKAIRHLRPADSRISTRYLRATFTTKMRDRGVNHLWLAIWQGHSTGSAMQRRHYDHSTNPVETEAVALAWDEYLDGVLTNLHLIGE